MIDNTGGQVKSDVLVFFGATGDLAYKKIFPALQSAIKHGSLDVPVIAVAKSGWSLEDLKGVQAIVWRSLAAGSIPMRSRS